jgi:alpha-1,2-mannosyltransferase
VTVARAELRTLILVGALYAVVVIALRWNHIGDVAHEIALADRWLRGESLYTTVVPGQGSLWPPFAALALLPYALLARIDLSLAAGVWSLVGVVCLVASVVLASRWGTRAALLALLAVAMPVQTNFEHHNANTILLVLVMEGAVDLLDHSDRRAGLWFGLAAALKAFPVVLILYLAFARRWRAFGAAIVVAVVATLLPLLRYGPGGFAAIGDWLRVGLDQGQWQLATSDQSLRALALRFGATPGLAIAFAIVPLAVAALIAVRHRGRLGDLPAVGAGTLAAVIASPLAWVHYYVLAYPAWVAVLSDRARTAVFRKAAVWVAAIATSGLLTAGQGPVRRALLGATVYAWGGLLLLVLLATMQPPATEPE